MIGQNAGRRELIATVNFLRSAGWATSDRRCKGLNEKCLPRAHVFEELVPSWWLPLGSLGNLCELGPSGGSRPLRGIGLMSVCPAHFPEDVRKLSPSPACHHDTGLCSVIHSSPSSFKVPIRCLVTGKKEQHKDVGVAPFLCLQEIREANCPFCLTTLQNVICISVSVPNSSTHPAATSSCHLLTGPPPILRHVLLFPSHLLMSLLGLFMRLTALCWPLSGDPSWVLLSVSSLCPLGDLLYPLVICSPPTLPASLHSFQLLLLSTLKMLLYPYLLNFICMSCMCEYRPWRYLVPVGTRRVTGSCEL